MSFDTKISGNLSAIKNEAASTTKKLQENDALSIFDKKSDIFKSTGNIHAGTEIACASKNGDKNTFFNNFSDVQKEHIKDAKNNPYVMNTCIDYSSSSGAIKDALNIKDSINNFFGIFSKSTTNEE